MDITIILWFLIAIHLTFDILQLKRTSVKKKLNKKLFQDPKINNFQKLLKQYIIIFNL